MSIEDNDNYYIIEEEEKDTSPLNYAAYEDHERQEEEVNEGKKSVSAIGLIFKTMFSPVEGWKKLRRSRISIEKLQAGSFYPLLALLAVSKFSDFFYYVDVSLNRVITEGIVAFVAYFFTYFCMPVVMSWVLPKEMSEKFDSKFGKAFTLVVLSTLVLFSIVVDLLPMLWPILIFLPIWTLYLMFKGVRFFKFEEKNEMKFFIRSGAAVIGLPLLIEWALNSVMPY